MPRPRIYTYSFSSIHQLYIEKVSKKGRSAAELNEVILWLTGYTNDELVRQISAGTDLEAFFISAPGLNPNRLLVTGKVCGVQVDAIEDPITRDIRIMDKLVDELAKGRPMSKILRNR